MTQPKYGYMCKTDWDYETGSARGGVIVYASIKDACRNNLCVRVCGVVKVKIELEEVIDDSEVHKITHQLPERRDSFDI